MTAQKIIVRFIVQLLTIISIRILFNLRIVFVFVIIYHLYGDD